MATYDVKESKTVRSLQQNFRNIYRKNLHLPISYITLYGDAASQQMSILLPNRFTILQPPPPLSTVLVLDGEFEAEFEAAVDDLGVDLELVVESPPTAFPSSPPGRLGGAVAPGVVEPEVVEGKAVFDVAASDAVDDFEAVALTVEPSPGILRG